MKFSIQFAVILIVGLLFLASTVSVYFALVAQNTVPLVLVATANIVAVILLTFLITRGIIRPMEEIRRVMHEVGKGEFSSRVQISGTQEMEELQDTLNEMIERVETMQEMKTEFVSLTAHQLRTPLSAIKWTLQMLLDGDAGKLRKEQQEFVEKMFQSNERMIRLINDLLNVTRIEEGRYLYQPSFLHIEEILDSMVQSYEDEATRKGVALKLEMQDTSVPRVLVDQEKMRLAVQNLLENALNYTGRGGKVTVSLSHDTKEVRVRVQDTGIGIPQNQQQRVFEKFFRATNAKRVDTDGSGLGLYLVKNIVKAHGGGISFESKEGKGTTFTFTLPVKEENGEPLKHF